MLLALHLALLSLPNPSTDFYSKIEDLKEPDWSISAPVGTDSNSDLYSRLDDLKVPDWYSEVEAPTPADQATNASLYVAIDDLKQPY